MWELFDLIAGTSTGGILACALCAPDPLPAEQLVALYEEEGPEIFDRSIYQRIRSADGLLDEKYDAAALDARAGALPAKKRLAETKPDLLVPAYNMGEPGPYFFKSRKAREEGEDFPLAEVARATSAAPTYFEPFPLRDWPALVDGGVFANNPAMWRLRGGDALPARRRCRAAVARHGAAHSPAGLRGREGLGPDRVGEPILDVVFDGVSDAVHYQLQHALDPERYWRLQVELTEANDDLDDATEQNLRRLREHAEQLIATSSADIDAAIAALT